MTHSMPAGKPGTSQDPATVAFSSADSIPPELKEGIGLAHGFQDAGKSVPLIDWFARHPQMAGQLASFLAGEVHLRNELAAIQEPALPSESGLFVDRYELQGRVGKGGEGIVVRAHDRKLNREVAVKRWHNASHGAEDQWARFRFEAEAVASLDHPNIVGIYDYGEENGSPYLVMPLMKESLSERLRSLGPDRCMDPDDAAELIRKVALGVHHAHQRGLLHRDLKPGNILFDQNDQPHVADFGLARRLDGNQSMSASGSIAGTASYMAPEQARGEKGLTVAADIHALGAILYELLTGTPPFGKGELVPTLKRVSEEEAVSVRHHRPDVSADLSAICMKCLEKQPGDRFYRSAAELAEDLGRFLNDEPVAVRPPGFWDWLRQMLRTRPHPNYSWQVPTWLGILLLVSNLNIYAMCQTGSSAGWIWANNLGCAVGIFVVFWWYMLRRFRDIPLTERHSLVIGVGHTLAHLALMTAYLPFSFSASARDYLVLYPAVMALSGLGLFTIGSTNWSRFFPVGLVLFGMTPLMARWPDESPLIFGITNAVLMWYWTIAKKMYFGNRPAETA